MTSKRTRRGVWLAAGLLAAAIAAVLLLESLDTSAMLPITAVIAAPPVGDLPMMPEKPPASPEGFNGCPPEGEGGDVDLNLLKESSGQGSIHPRITGFHPGAHLAQERRAAIHERLDRPRVGLSSHNTWERRSWLKGMSMTLREGVADAANCNRADEDNHLLATLHHKASQRSPLPGRDRHLHAPDARRSYLDGGLHPQFPHRRTLARCASAAGCISIRITPQESAARAPRFGRSAP